jgi:NadR type nicotinamide-nucleotide adenylyltransferase
MEKKISLRHTTMIHRIAITGPESTGKSTLARLLAETFQSVWVPEYAREYLLKVNRPYRYKDILKIARGQKALEEALLPSARQYLFCDTDFIVLKVWCEDKYGKCHRFIREQVKNNVYDLYLLTDIDFPWSWDPLREDPHRREYLFRLYLSELEINHFPYQVVSGSNDQRLANAIRSVNNFFG